MSTPRDYDFITTCNWTETGNFYLNSWNQLFYRKKGSTNWIEAYGSIDIDSTGEWEIANDFNGKNNMTHQYENITAIDACTEIYINEEALGTSVGDNFLYNLFINCTNLTSLPEGFNLPQNLQSAGNNFLVSAFYGCSSLTSMPEGFNLPQNLTSVGYSFLSATWYYCSNLTSLPEGFNLPQNLQTTGYGFMASCWSDCWNLTSMPEGFNLPQNLTSIGNEFLSGTWRACNKLTSLPLGFSLPEVLTDMSNNQILQGCWEGCSSLSQDGYTEDLIFKFEARGVFQGTYFDPGYIINGSSTNPVLIPISRTLPPTADDHYVVTFRRTGDESDKTIDRNTWEDVVSFINGNKHALTKISFEVVNSPDKPTDLQALFADTPYLTDVDLTGLDTSEVTNINGMFMNCQNLINLDISDLDTSSATDMGAMFMGCQSLESLDLSHFDTSQVFNMSFMFAQCSNLETLDISNFDTSNVIYIDNLFLQCSSLTDLDLSHFDTEQVISMQYMFYGCQSLTSLNLNSFQTGAVTNMSNMFQDCVSLTEVTLGSFDTSQVIEMQSMFHGCAELELLHLDSFNTSLLEWSNSMFAYCTKLETILVADQWVNDKLAYSKNMFLDCTSLVGAVPYNPNKVSGSMANYTTGYFTNVNPPPEPLIDFYTVNYQLGGASEEVELATFEEVASFLMDIITDVEKVSIHQTGNPAKPTNFYYLFYGASSLTDVDMGNVDTSEVTDMSYMFSECSSLENLNISNFDTSQVTSMDRMFFNCNSLINLDLSHFDTSQVINMDTMFAMSSYLESLDVSNFDTSNLTSMNEMFNSCESLTSLDLSSFDTSSVTNMSGMFTYCTALQTILVSELWDNSAVQDSWAMFEMCESLVGAVPFDPEKVDAEMANYTTGYFTLKTEPQPPTHLPIELELTNCQSSIEDEIAIGSNIPVTFTANEGFEFIENGKLYYNEGGVAKEVDIIVTAQDKQFTIYFNILANFTDIRLTLTASAEPPPEPEPALLVDGTLYQTGYSGLTDVEIANFLKRTFTDSEKALVSTLITQIEDELCRATNRNFKVDDDKAKPQLVQYYEYFTGDFLKVMVQNSPVNSMTGIEIEGVDKTSLYQENKDYWIYDNQIVFASAVTSSGRDFKSVKITYTIKKFWGEDVILLLTKWIAYEFLKSENAGMGNTSMSFADISQNFDVSNFIKERDKVIFRYIDFEI